MIDNGDGTVSFRDVTQYSNVEDSNILANVLNTANDAINRMMNGEIFYTEAEVDALLTLKQNLLAFDDSPIAGSNNPVKSSGIKTALDAVNSRIDNLSVFSFYICGNGEYDPVTGQPTIQNPDTSTFYLVPTGSSPDVFTEWVYINNNWEKFGSTTVDLSNYVTTSDLQDALDDKQDVLTFDSTPTDNSQNPVTSDGIYDALSGKSDTGHNHDSRYYIESEVDTLLAGKSDISHNHDSRYYTESEVDTLLSGKSDTSSTYTSAQVDTLLSAKVDNTSIGSMAVKDQADWDTDIANIPSSFPPSSHNHSADNITSGTLAINRGGTGAGTIDDMKDDFGLWYKPGDSISIASGAGSYSGFLAFAKTARIVIPLNKPVKAGTTVYIYGSFRIRVEGATLVDVSISSSNAAECQVTDCGLQCDITSSNNIGTTNSLCAVGSRGITITFA